MRRVEPNTMPLYVTKKTHKRTSLAPHGKRILMPVTTVAVRAGYARNDHEFEIKYYDPKVIGNGTFGVVYIATLYETGDKIAIKKVEIDKRFKNRELQLMKRLEHPNIVRLLYHYESVDDHKNEYLNLMLEFLPKTFHQLLRSYKQVDACLPSIYVKLYMFQLLRALNYIHMHKIVHRDVKPQNLLVNHELALLKICDFGSAKELQEGDSNITYICSRYYRAPELLFNSTEYGTTIDLWSASTVMAEIYLKSPIFSADNAIDQIVQIIKVLGAPTRKDIESMNPKYAGVPISDVPGIGLAKLLKGHASSHALEVLGSLLKYNPNERAHPLEILSMQFFDDLRKPETTLPDGAPLPPIFEWYQREVELSYTVKLQASIFPTRRTPAGRSSNSESSKSDSNLSKSSW
ncbi:hypothetical protein WR25_25101 [Diploscapter pachys]|uniref:Protein kinase domain-containing protein n=1 Tax=Diploscapter pachys TaxID=2018661 RepID=A0A2A2K5G0_9BILA|nr:hypothetical protein WR25_25101 [Diploscapter pachys]